MSLYLAAIIDTSLVLICAILMWKYGRLSALHPASMYFVFHIMVFTLRIYAILAGSPLLFSWRGGLPVSEAEIAWAANLADLALVMMTAAWIRVATVDQQRQTGSSHDIATATANTAMLSERVIWIVGAIAAPVGIVALIYFGNTPTVGVYKVDLGDWNTSSWTVVTQSWAGLVLLALIYFYGFRKPLTALAAIYLLIMAFQGYDRFRVIVACLFLLMVWLTRHGRKWPPVWMMTCGVLLLLAFFPLKTIGHMMQKGDPISDITEVSSNIISDVTTGRNQDQMIMDEFASTVSLVDDSHRYFYGSLYYPLLTIAIPRQWWSDKPPLNWFLSEISTPSRPMARLGMEPTLHGESYGNLGIVGVAVISYFSAFCLGRFYFQALQKPYYSIYRFMYIVITCNLCQVYRDGLVSLVVFTVVNMTPLVVIAVFSWFTFRSGCDSVVMPHAAATTRKAHVVEA